MTDSAAVEPAAESTEDSVGRRWVDRLALAAVVLGPFVAGRLAAPFGARPNLADEPPRAAVIDRWFGEGFDSWWGGPLDPQVAFVAVVVAHVMATAGFVRLVRGVVRGRLRPGLGMILGVAIAMRLLCVLGHGPSLSDDVYRYVHEGRMVQAGVNPYAVAPLEVEPGLRGPEWPAINNAEIPAVYPPAMQFTLAVAVWLDPSPLGMRLVFGMVDVLVALALWGLLRVRGIDPARAVVWAWCPLAALEYSGQAHGDCLAVLWSVLAVAASARGGRWLWAAGVAFGLATASKFLPIVLLPFALRRRAAVDPGRTSGRDVLVGQLAFALTLVVLGWSFWSPHALRGMTEYVGRWRSNDSLFAGVHAASAGLLDLIGSSGELRPDTLAKGVLAVGGVVLLAYAWIRDLAPERVALAFFTFFVAAAPTVHPWYLGLWLPWVALRPSVPWLWFTGTVILAYHVLPGWVTERVWVESPVWKVVEYAPFYVGFFVSVRCRGSGAIRGDALGRIAD